MVFGQISLQARGIRNWSYDELVKASDLVVIIETLKNEKNEDTLKVNGIDDSSVQGVSTTFHVLYCWKGVPPSGDLVVKHFVYKPDVGSVNGALFIHFLTEPINFEGKVYVGQKNKGPVDAVQFCLAVPNWLAFLKKAPDGAFIPATGQVAPMHSFKELREVLFSPWQN